MQEHPIEFAEPPAATLADGVDDIFGFGEVFGQVGQAGHGGPRKAWQGIAQFLTRRSQTASLLESDP
jgi:hypothetical protein